MGASPEPILLEAQRITTADRRAAYDAATANHTRIAGAWNWYLSSRPEPGAQITPKDAAMMMLLLKVARETHSTRRDNLVDIAGYARIVAQIEGHEPE